MPNTLHNGIDNSQARTHKHRPHASPPSLTHTISQKHPTTRQNSHPTARQPQTHIKDLSPLLHLCHPSLDPLAEAQLHSSGHPNESESPTLIKTHHPHAPPLSLTPSICPTHLTTRYSTYSTTVNQPHTNKNDLPHQPHFCHPPENTWQPLPAS
jgi:hypothetical protein